RVPSEAMFALHRPFAEFGPLALGFATVPLRAKDCVESLQSPVCTPSGETGGRSEKVADPETVDFGSPPTFVTFCLSTSFIEPASGFVHVNAPESPWNVPVQVPSRPVKTVSRVGLHTLLRPFAFAQTAKSKMPGDDGPARSARSESHAGAP